MNKVAFVSSSPSICIGCLSEDRKVKLLNSYELDNVFYAIVGHFEYVVPPVLCWECFSFVKRFVKFKNQVKNAQHQLQSYNQSETKLSSLSTLKNYISTDYIQFTHTDKVIERVEVKTEIDIEDFSNENLFVSDFYIEDNNDDGEHKPVIKSDSFQENIPESNTNITTKRRRKKKDILEFDESDDEPLTVKKKRREVKIEGVKVRKKRKDSKKNSDGSTRVVNNARVVKRLESLNVPKGQIDMVVLSWEEVKEEREKALKSVTFTRHQYKCYDCVLGFNHKFKLDNHMKKHDASSGANVCDVCKVRCKDAHAFNAHKRRHQVRWRCCVCGVLSSRASTAADHNSREHAAPAPTHTCHVCGHVDTTLGKLRNHIKNHAERQKCELCEKTFRDRTSLKTHLFIHKGEKEYACDKCDKRFHFKKAMEVHMVTHESSAQMYCHECNMNFKNKMSFYQHMKYNLKHIDPAKLKHVCTKCGKRFVKLSRLLEHDAAVHLKTTPIPCTVQSCKFSAASRGVIRAHIVSRHTTRVRRDHVCHTCGKQYTSKKSLEGHMRTHTGERPYSCDICNSTFGYQAALYNHNKLVHLKTKSRNAPAPSATGLSNWNISTALQAQRQTDAPELNINAS